VFLQYWSRDDYAYQDEFSAAKKIGTKFERARRSFKKQRRNFNDTDRALGGVGAWKRTEANY
jgi:hypothetical protein